MGARPHGGNGPKVLVVDDDVEQLQLCAQLLGKRCEVVTAGSPPEALEKLEGERFDLVLSDQCMPEMFGTEFLARVRQIQPETRRVVMSAHAEAAEILPAIDAGDVHRFLPKPVRPDELLSAYEPGDEKVRCLLLGTDERRLREVADSLASEPTFEVKTARNPNGAEADLVVLVTPGPVRRTEETVSMLRVRSRNTAVMAALAPEAVEDGPGYLAAGTDDLLWLPIRAQELRLRYQTWKTRRRASQEAARVRSGAAAEGALPDVVGESEPMRRVFHQIHRVASSDASVLLIGETGTGKEVLARAVHALSPRREEPFLAVNLSAIPESLVESELFGHEKGAFTGARAPREGRLEAVSGGTLFLDEVGDLSLGVQVKLLRVLEQRTFERLGSTKLRTTDFRLVCATHRNLEELVADGSFREDLFYRINVVHIDVPPLRERGEDVRLLAEHFLGKYCRKYGTEGVTLSEEAIRALLQSDWPGNVRQLQHLMERAVAMSSAGAVIDAEQLRTRAPRASFRRKVDRGLDDGRGLREILADIERTMLVETLERFGGNQVAAAKKLRIPRQTLQNRLKKYGL